MFFTTDFTMSPRAFYELAALARATEHAQATGGTWHEHLVRLEACLIWYMRNAPLTR